MDQNTGKTDLNRDLFILSFTLRPTRLSGLFSCWQHDQFLGYGAINVDPMTRVTLITPDIKNEKPLPNQLNIL